MVVACPKFVDRRMLASYQNLDWSNNNETACASPSMSGNCESGLRSGFKFCTICSAAEKPVRRFNLDREPE
jgi:hypothetical protein